MHHHLEVVIPPTDNVTESVKQVMARWDENAEGDDASRHAFWDFYVIGGRWAGDKFIQSLDKDFLQQFYDWCTAEKVTCSGLVFGKREINPACQIPKVDAKWNELFTPAGSTPVACPLFSHSNDQFDSNDQLDGDVWPLAKSLNVSCSHIIFAGPKYVDGEFTLKQLEADNMFRTETWNGCTWQKTDWDGTVKHAVEMVKKHQEHMREEYRAMVEPQDDWLCVTVDYHS